VKNPIIRAGVRGIVAALVAGPLLAASAYAADMTPQQERMKTCSAQNKGKKGDDYKSAQSACLKGETPVAAAPVTQQQKMAMCSKQNKGKKGDDYKNAQSACLKG
jgi:hypothetical protein